MRGARNFPCMDAPGKYAPTVELCKSDKVFQPLAARPHALGPSPFDPNLVGQGVPLDDRVTGDEHIFPPPAAVATYDPVTGRVATADGSVQQQTDLASPAESWKDLVWPAQP